MIQHKRPCPLKAINKRHPKLAPKPKDSRESRKKKALNLDSSLRKNTKPKHSQKPKKSMQTLKYKKRHPKLNKCLHLLN